MRTWWIFGKQHEDYNGFHKDINKRVNYNIAINLIRTMMDSLLYKNRNGKVFNETDIKDTERMKNNILSEFEKAHLENEKLRNALDSLISERHTDLCEAHINTSCCICGTAKRNTIINEALGKQKLD
jgi:hypothetical protein